MPAPISSNNSSVYDPSAQQSLANDCDPMLSSCVSQPAVEIEPVHIDGDAGKQALLQRLEASRCSSDKNEAVLALVAVGVAVQQVSPLAAFLGSAAFAKELSEYSHCREASAQLNAAIGACEARDGTPLKGARDGELICLVPAP
jgi:hypothetical protein